ncbi:ketopantoate reductase family protein [Ornithinimicrobium murale]|uniref:ketopantoate reductase family protein n=1 Tax=Ornithinimicrobium murale TaxID=1050153 RepID=UPI000E0DE3D0|nr:2-dehydropantoate 2-reductase [Ornithinimicrobium murale]
MARVIIVGMGAMGSVYAALMQDAGHEVHGVCHWPEHVAAIRRGGLRVHGFSGDRTVQLASVATDTQGLPVADLVIIATKAGDVEAAADSARHLVGPRTVVQGIQNGLGSPERIAATLGRERLAVGVVGGFGASCPEPGTVHHNGMEMIRFASYAELPAADLARGSAVWQSAGFRVQMFENVDQMVWEKFIMNVTFSGTSCLTGLTIGEIMQQEAAWSVAQGCAEEAVAVAQAKGITLDVGDPVEHIRALGSRIPDARPSMLLDALAHRPGEVDAINGAVVTEGRTHGVPTPVNDTVSNLVRARERTYSNHGHGA